MKKPLSTSTSTSKELISLPGKPDIAVLPAPQPVAAVAPALPTDSRPDLSSEEQENLERLKRQAELLREFSFGCYWEPFDEEYDQERPVDCQPFYLDDSLAPDGRFDKEAADRIDLANLLFALKRQANRLQAGYLQNLTSSERTQNELSSEKERNAQAEEAAMLAEKGPGHNFNIVNLMRELNFLREHRPSNHLLELLPMLSTAYSLIYGLWGNSRNSAYGRKILQGTKLSALEYGFILLVEFDRFTT